MEGEIFGTDQFYVDPTITYQPWDERLKTTGNYEKKGAGDRDKVPVKRACPPRASTAGLHLYEKQLMNPAILPIAEGMSGGLTFDPQFIIILFLVIICILIAYGISRVNKLIRKVKKLKSKLGT